jgi:serralysin
VVVRPDGRIVVAGATGSLFGSRTDFAMSRFAPDSSLDRNFGMDGTVVTDWDGLSDRAHRVLLQNDGRIVLVGFAGMKGGTGADFAVARYTTDGTLDASSARTGR